MFLFDGHDIVDGLIRANEWLDPLYLHAQVVQLRISLNDSNQSNHGCI